MRERSIHWLMVVSAISCLIWMGGLAWTLQHYLSDAAAAPAERAPVSEESSPAPVLENDDGSFRLLALGDSLTRGSGDPEGRGYVGYLLDHLKEKSEQKVIMENYGVDGQTSSQLALLLQERELLAQVKAADVIVISIGGNDLFRGGETLGHLDPVKIQEIEDTYLRELDGILKQLREENAAARIFLIGLYNPFIELQDTETTSKIVRDWNYKAAEVAAQHPQTILVPTFDLFQLKVQDYLASDLFHPNAAGYRLIGDRVASLITW
ncbi:MULTISPECIES: GDSL-type esterase/lipase family protein [unclassified Paenibacillus]|uniref:GDSL-type esterase/lipase family protein n=1 Tax=unclassified Paenibacillus TaxID=185978 RepID=UPI001AE5117F|nr:MULTISPECIES: GDSL-type esterase/lipase family protein [unclassified Paenibacillus]MBP1157633.1 lysophospholipase L1-like esterase [Paenibacillus sp. PvP091]MBP1171630.1 lysophospholipase L1-like esterase [Paenibacillus sp. PvR098]MBP2438011.1 lysophospholipase L1-like esterase [Paenibacillus sp. PvP052]